MKYTEQEKYMSQAYSEAKKALKKNEVPVGCVIVKDGKIISRGYNLRETKQNSLMHAEIIAINKACKKLNNFRLEACEMYVTLEPCLMCAGAIVQSRIKKLYFGAQDPKYGAVISVAKALDITSNHKVEVQGKILEKKCSALIKEFFKDLRESQKNKCCRKKTEL